MKPICGADGNRHLCEQKVQRSFAAALLISFAAVEDLLVGDYPQERRQDVAEYFDVSPVAIDTLLKKHGRLERVGSEKDFCQAAASSIFGNG